MADVTPEDMATEKALAALDMLADQWAERVDLLRIVGAVANDPGKVKAMEQKFRELLRRYRPNKRAARPQEPRGG